MKKKRTLKFIISLILIALISLYRFDCAAAMPNPNWDAEAGQEAPLTPDLVSSGTELAEWMESHKNTGGTVKLTNHVVLDGVYCFSHNRPNQPSMFVDAGGYTITVTGEAEFISDNHLTFLGKGDDDGILHTAKGGMLTLSGVTVENVQPADAPQYVLWQEEGSGLVVDSCHVTGDIHYADTPFVPYDNSVCAVAEKGQTAEDVLPSELECNVNRRGQMSYNEPVPVTWNLTGTEKYQEERRRFYVQGISSNVVFMESPVCTVVYNDYPLTFLNVRVRVSGNSCLFRMWFSKPEENLPIVVSSEYSFDGENWNLYEESTVTHVSDSLFLGLTTEQWDTAEHPFVYLRLQWDKEGTKYFSNVLQYAADNMEYGEDQGGSRGGGTSIVNPPDEPQEEDKLPGDAAGDDTVKPSGDAAGDDTVKPSGDAAGDDTVKPFGDTAGDDIVKPSVNAAGEGESRRAGNSEGESVIEPSGNAPGENISAASGEPADESLPDISGERDKPAYGENDEDSPGVQKTVAGQDTLHNRNIAIITCFVMVCVMAGGAGFCLRAGIFGRMFRAVKRILTK